MKGSNWSRRQRPKLLELEGEFDYIHIVELYYANKEYYRSLQRFFCLALQTFVNTRFH